jgi:hypothetical protein
MRLYLYLYLYIYNYKDPKVIIIAPLIPVPTLIPLRMTA